MSEHRDWLKEYEPRAADFQVIGTDELVELKSDKYVSKNFFFEHYYDLAKQKLGGPYVAQERGVKWFVYWFTKTGQYYVFETDALIARLKELRTDDYVKYVPNKKWTSSGYAMPILLFEGLYQEYHNPKLVIP